MDTIIYDKILENNGIKMVVAPKSFSGRRKQDLEEVDLRAIEMAEHADQGLAVYPDENGGIRISVLTNVMKNDDVLPGRDKREYVHRCVCILSPEELIAFAPEMNALAHYREYLKTVDTRLNGQQFMFDLNALMQHAPAPLDEASQKLLAETRTDWSIRILSFMALHAESEDRIFAIDRNAFFEMLPAVYEVLPFAMAKQCAFFLDCSPKAEKFGIFEGLKLSCGGVSEEVPPYELPQLHDKETVVSVLLHLDSRKKFFDCYEACIKNAAFDLNLYEILAVLTAFDDQLCGETTAFNAYRNLIKDAPSLITPVRQLLPSTSVFEDRIAKENARKKQKMMEARQKAAQEAQAAREKEAAEKKRQADEARLRQMEIALADLAGMQAAVAQIDLRSERIETTSEECQSQLQTMASGLECVSGMPSQLVELKESIGHIQTDLSGISKAVPDLSRDMAMATDDIGALKTGMAEIATQIEALRTQTDGLAEALEKTLTQTEEKNEAQENAAYESLRLDMDTVKGDVLIIRQDLGKLKSELETDRQQREKLHEMLEMVMNNQNSLMQMISKGD